MYESSTHTLSGDQQSSNWIRNHVWFQKPSQLPGAGEDMDLRREPTSASLLYPIIPSCILKYILVLTDMPSSHPTSKKLSFAAETIIGNSNWF